MSKQKHAGSQNNSQQPKAGKLIMPSEEDVRKFGAAQNVKTEGIHREKLPMFGELDDGFKKVMDGYSDAELEKMNKNLGFGGAFQKIMEEAMFGPALPALRQKLKDARRSGISDEVEDYFDDVRARCMLTVGIPFKMMQDDRFGENMEITYALFDHEPKIEVDGEHPVERYMRSLQAQDEGVGEFMMRLESEYLKLLIYYCKMSGFNDIKKIMDRRWNRDSEEDNCHYRKHVDPIGLIGNFPLYRLEDMLRATKASSMDDFDALFFKKPDLIPFLRKANWEVVKTIVGMGKPEGVDGFCKLFSDDGFCDRIAKIEYTPRAGKNFTAVLAKFGISDIEGVKGFLNSGFPFYQINNYEEQIFAQCLEISGAKTIGEFGQFLSAVSQTGRGAFLMDNLGTIKAKFGLESYEEMIGLVGRADLVAALEYANPKNVRVLLRVSPHKNVDQLCDEIRKPEVADALRNAKYDELEGIFDCICFDEAAKAGYMYNMLTRLDSATLHLAALLQPALKMAAPSEKLAELVYLSVMNGAAEQNVLAISALAKEGNLLTTDEVETALELMKFSGGVLTEELARNLIHSNNADAQLREWEDVLRSFEKGKFDHENRLHRNLEYLRFRRIIDNEKIRKHIKERYTFQQYERIFDAGKESRKKLDEKDLFEVQCVACESKLLKEFILEVKKAADAAGRKTVVVPNMSYGYLPIAPLMDELAKEGVELIVGAKVGSTQCHDNHDYLDASLFKKHRTEIVNEQPVIIVVDGTKHLVDGRNGHAARYPDAYQGYLNHVIALNDAAGFGSKNYGKFGKTDEDMASLREDYEFSRAVKRYRELRREGGKMEEYSFGFWNSAGLELAIRNQRNHVSRFEPMDAGKITGPTIIFANVGSLPHQIPSEIRRAHGNLVHEPAYFDDKGKIIDFDFRFDKFGVKYVNTLESEVKKAYAGMDAGTPNSNIDGMAGILKFISKKLPMNEGHEPAFET